DVPDVPDVEVDPPSSLPHPAPIASIRHMPIAAVARLNISPTPPEVVVGLLFRTAKPCFGKP
ncbi:MAG TPA: hypothetical protein VIL49_12710, partial [Capillimicrobium sp.]